MNPYSGEIERFPTRSNGDSTVPSGWLELTDAEAAEFARLPNDVRLEHYRKAHHSAKCGACGCFIGNHSLRKFKECAANELARFDMARIERQAKELFEQVPRRDLTDYALSVESLRAQVDQLP
jgi:hypothetical protein